MLDTEKTNSVSLDTGIGENENEQPASPNDHYFSFSLNQNPIGKISVQ